MHKNNISSNRNSLIDPNKISVVLPVFNGQSFLKEAIDSILEQSFQDFEFIIINDGSTDNTLNIAQQHNCKIIHISREEFSFGRSLNWGCAKSSGEIIIMINQIYQSYFICINMVVKISFFRKDQVNIS